MLTASQRARRTRYFKRLKNPSRHFGWPAAFQIEQCNIYYYNVPGLAHPTETDLSSARRTAFAEPFRRQPLGIFRAPACPFSRQKRGNCDCTRPFDGPGTRQVQASFTPVYLRYQKNTTCHADVHTYGCSTPQNHWHTCRPPCPAVPHLGMSTFDISSMLSTRTAPCMGMCLKWFTGING